MQEIECDEAANSLDANGAAVKGQIYPPPVDRTTTSCCGGGIDHVLQKIENDFLPSFTVNLKYLALHSIHSQTKYRRSLESFL